MDVSGAVAFFVYDLRSRSSDPMRLFKFAVNRVVVVRANRQANFVYRKPRFAIRMEGEVPRSLTRAGVGRCVFVEIYLPSFVVDVVDQNLVEAKVTDDESSVRRIDRHRVSVRLPLSGRNYVAPSDVLMEVARLVQAPVLIDREHRHTAAGVVGDEEVLASLLNDQMARTRTLRRLLVDYGQRTVVTDAVGVDAASIVTIEIVDFGDGVEVFPVWMQRDERRIGTAVSGYRLFG